MYFPDWFLWLIIIVGDPITWVIFGALIVAAIAYTVHKLRKKDRHD